jgi:hypothetical protein
MLNSKPTFYMLMFGSKTFIPEIKDYCGHFVEIEEIISSLSVKDSCNLRFL